MSGELIETPVIERIRAAEAFMGDAENDLVPRVGFASSAVEGLAFVHNPMNASEGLSIVATSEVVDAVVEIFGGRVLFDPRVSNFELETAMNLMREGRDNELDGTHYWPLNEGDLSVVLLAGRTSGEIAPYFSRLFLSRESLERAQLLRIITK